MGAEGVVSQGTNPTTAHAGERPGQRPPRPSPRRPPSGHSAGRPAGAVVDALLEVEVEPAGFCVHEVVLRRAPVLGSVLDALAQDDSREALPADAPVASELVEPDLELVRGVTPVRSGKPPALVVEGGAGPSEVGV